MSTHAEVELERPELVSHNGHEVRLIEHDMSEYGRRRLEALRNLATKRGGRMTLDEVRELLSLEGVLGAAVHNAASRLVEAERVMSWIDEEDAA